MKRKIKHHNLIDNSRIRHIYYQAMNKVLVPNVLEGGFIHQLSTTPTINNIETMHRKVLNVPIKLERDMRLERNVTVMLAHRKTHKRIRQYFQHWKPIEVIVKLEHRPWKELK